MNSLFVLDVLIITFKTNYFLTLFIEQREGKNTEHSTAHALKLSQ